MDGLTKINYVVINRYFFDFQIQFLLSLQKSYRNNFLKHQFLLFLYIFFNISFETKTDIVIEDQIDDFGMPTHKQANKTILYINVDSLSAEEMMKKYKFNLTQKNEVNELLKKEYANLWYSVIYGTSMGNPDVVQVTLSKIGNEGGKTYWSS